MSNAHVEGSQSDVQILIKAVDETGEEVVVETAGTLIMGRRASFVALVNGKQIPVGDFLNPVWTVAGNTHPYAAIIYQSQLGHVAEADLYSYPLSTVLLPTVPGVWTTTATLVLSGQVLVPPIPAFLSSRPFPLMSPGRMLSTVTQVYGTAIQPYIDASGRTFIGLTNPQGGRGARVDCTYAATWSDTGGKLRVVQLADVYLYTEHPDTGRVYDVNTNGEYWFDGSDFPYMEVAIPGRGQNTISWWDTPGVFFTDKEKDVNLTIGWKANFRTYFFYQDNAPQSAPVMAGFPLQWGAAWNARWNGTSIEIFNDQVNPLTTYKSMTMPTWNNHLPNKPTLAEKPPAVVGTSIPTTLYASDPEDASRSVRVTFKNYSNAFMARQSTHLDHGIWSENLYPPEQVGAGTTTIPTTVEWASESQGFMTGTEGYVVYLLEDGESTVKVYWDNPYGGENAWSVTLNGPLGQKYAGSAPGPNHDDNAKIEVTLKNK